MDISPRLGLKMKKGLGYLQLDKFRTIHDLKMWKYYVPLKEYALNNNYSYSGALQRVKRRKVYAVRLKSKWYVFDKSLLP